MGPARALVSDMTAFKAQLTGRFIYDLRALLPEVAAMKDEMDRKVVVVAGFEAVVDTLTLHHVKNVKVELDEEYSELVFSFVAMMVALEGGCIIDRQRFYASGPILSIDPIAEASDFDRWPSCAVFAVTGKGFRDVGLVFTTEDDALYRHWVEVSGLVFEENDPDEPTDEEIDDAIEERDSVIDTFMKWFEQYHGRPPTEAEISQAWDTPSEALVIQMHPRPHPRPHPDPSLN